ncbi:S8 family serine peptidase [Sorangium sp. So ce375]|uniref:S8 family serine peptidase n=1 Tax=Sorangium sp. So ce375 TaxID=3133306 RepID=UPI003F5C5ECD
MFTKFRRACLAAGVLTTVAAPATVQAASYIVLAHHDFDADFQRRITAAGGRLTAILPNIGVAMVVSNDPGFRARTGAVPSVRSVAADIEVQLQPPPLRAPVAANPVAELASPPFTGDDDEYFDLQWGHTALRTVDAWATGVRGAGALVAVVDSGIDAEHPDLAPNLRPDLSRSFVPGEDWNIAPGAYFHHGTHVAGIIAAADNGVGVIGVAPEAEIFAVKVLSERTTTGTVSGILQGIVYAAETGADIINMSLGAYIPRNNCTFGGVSLPTRDCTEIIVAFSRATRYARRLGSTVIAAAGNDARDLDHDAALVVVPAQLPGVTAISATGPVGWALDPVGANLDRLASYSNFGQSVIDFAAPGGDFVYPGTESCTVAGVTNLCSIFDLVFSTFSEGWGWAAGTSMAAAHASGVAALIVSSAGGPTSPEDVERTLRASSDDLGKPGNDDAYGAGRVNALNAVTE